MVGYWLLVIGFFWDLGLKIWNYGESTIGLLVIWGMVYWLLVNWGLVIG